MKNFFISNCVTNKTKNLLFVLFFTVFLVINSRIFAAELVKGNSEVEGQSFTFCTGPYAIDAVGEFFYITSKENGAGEFTISRFGAFENQFKPLCPEQASILANDNVPNPLYSKGIKYFSLLDMKKDKGVNSYPVLVTNDNQNIIYVLDLTRYFGKLYDETKKDVKTGEDNITGGCTVKTSKVSVILYDNIKNTAGNPITQINGIATSPMGYIFAGVDIGTANGGITFLRLAPAHSAKNLEIEEHKITEELNALEQGKSLSDLSGNDASKAKNTGNNKNKITQEQKSQAKNGKNKNAGMKQVAEKTEVKTFLGLFPAIVTQALNVTSNVTKIASDLASINFADMYWDNALSCLFIALQVQAGAAGTDGCKALVLGKFDKDGALVLSDFAPSAVFSAQDQIVGAVGANAQVSLHKVRTMHTSNRLPYVVVLGKNGAPGATSKSVYALPLVNASDGQDNGMLANKNSLPTDKFSSSTIKMFIARYLSGKATDSSQIYTLTDDQACVGADPLGVGPLGNDISDIFVVGDAVFALVKSPANNGNGGLFISRALFDQYGKIKRWTEWANYSTSTAPLFGASLNSVFGDFIFMSGVDSNNVKTVKRTVWSDGDVNGIKDLSTVIEQQFPKNIAGVQGLFEFPCTLNGSVAPGMHDITLLVATGYKKVLLAELAQVSGGVLVRNTGNFSDNAQTFNNGQITANFPIAGARVVAIGGGALDNIGAIQAATITFPLVGVNNGRLFVGGVNGLAVLVDNSGNGWVTGLGPSFAGLTNTMAFRTVGNFKFVRKLVQDGNYLYILTDTKLYRANLVSGSNNFTAGLLDTTEIANFTNVIGMNKYSSFLDFVVSDKLGVLATSAGLFRVGNGQDIATSVASSINWTNIVIPTALGPVKQLFQVSSTLREQDFAAQNKNGVLYILSSYYGNDSSQFNRFTVNYDTQINDNSILALPDYYIQSSTAGVGSNSYFVNFGAYRNILDDEGAIRYVSEDRNLIMPPIFNILIPGLECGVISSGLINKNQYLQLSIENDSEIVRILRSSTGPVIVAGDFGFKVNE